MTIKELQREIEDSLEAVQAMPHLPAELQGLRLLVPHKVDCRVTIRNVQNGGRLRSDASAQDFRPQDCEVILRFESYADDAEEESAHGFSAPEDIPLRPEMEELIDALERIEGSRNFVGLKWFRDRFLPEEGYSWADDRGFCGHLIREATEEKLLLTSQVPNPRDPMQPTTAIRINRSHPRFRQLRAEPRPRAFNPIRARGKPLSATVREDRR